MHYEGSIRAVNLLLRDFVSTVTTVSSGSRALDLVKTRFAAKFEEPCSELAAKRRKDAWERWIGTDEELRTQGLYGPNWAKARLLVHQILNAFSLGNLTFTNGSSFVPLGNHLSVACKLSEVWTITHDCFELFAKMSFWHRALKHAVKKRFKRYCREHGYSERAVNRILWNRFKNRSEPNYQIYRFKLFCTVTFVYGNRWSTVPKNNSKDRSICLEPSCNMLVQRAVGLGIRKCLLDTLGIDLDHLADVHRGRISDQTVATIDLSDCSDTISLRLIRYLLPKRVLDKVLASRSDMTLGPDDNYYIVNKVSSMGNGFTFDLMTLILTALTRSFDSTSTVFGDDIICRNAVAEEVVSNLQIAGFKVNVDKTYINSSYRESCGAHFIDDYGYVTTFDLRWLQVPHDLIVACNKVAILSCVYGEPFTTLRAGIWSRVSRSLLGAAVERPTVFVGRPPSYDLDSFVRYGPRVNVDPPKKLLKSIRRACRDLCKRGNISVAVALESRQTPAPTSLSSDQWDVFFQYLHSGRRTRKFQRLVIKSTLVARVDEEQIGFVNALRSERT